MHSQTSVLGADAANTPSREEQELTFLKCKKLLPPSRFRPSFTDPHVPPAAIHNPNQDSNLRLTETDGSILIMNQGLAQLSHAILDMSKQSASSQQPGNPEKWEH